MCTYLCTISLFPVRAADSQLPISREYQVKAVFLFNFAQFVEWPSSAFADADSPMTIGVLGTDPFGNYLDDTVKDERIKGRSLLVQRFRRWEEIKACHILFVSRSQSNQLEQIVGGLAGKNVLTVGDFDGFAQRGGMIRFLTDNGRVRLRIRLDAVKAANLVVSSKLLRPSQLIGPGKD